VLSDVSQPDLIGPRGGEVTLSKSSCTGGPGRLA
jgi:hypothetical protein